MAGIDRRRAGGDQHQEGRLRPPQVKGDFVVAVSGEAVEVLVEPEARIDAQLLLRLPHQEIPRALDVLRRERLAVMPFDALAQRKVSRVPSSFQDQSVARSGTID